VIAARPSPDDRLEAAAIAIKMIAAKAQDVAPYLELVARRFAVDETSLRDAIGTRATERVYERIHGNTVPQHASARTAA
jgi:hypothetical protein